MPIQSLIPWFSMMIFIKTQVLIVFLSSEVVILVNKEKRGSADGFMKQSRLNSVPHEANIG